VCCNTIGNEDDSSATEAAMLIMMKRFGINVNAKR
jgi:hypothetical protein